MVALHDRRWVILLALIALVSVCLLSFEAKAQQVAAPDVEEVIDTLRTQHWTGDLVFDVAATQIGYQNWVEGGVNSFSFNTRLDGEAARAGDNWLQSYRLRLGIGAVKQDSLDVRKAEDVIRLAAGLQYSGEGFFHIFRPTVSVEARTQFTAGYNYSRNPFEGDNRDPPVKVSDFFAPAVLTQSLGLTYHSDGWLRQRLGMAGRETIVALERFRPLYGLRQDQATRLQFGVESNTELRIDVMENVHYRSSLNLFAAFGDEELPDMLWENQVIMDINRFLKVRLDGVAFYDRHMSRRLQLKQVLSIGVSISLV